MTEQAPLTPSDCNLQDFAFMPLDVARLRDSDLAANESPEACWAAVQLWAASWHQVPAGSIPDDDKWLAKATGYGRGVKDWMRVREGALRGFVMCSDGRLYHSVVAEKALEAWEAKIAQRYRTEVARVKKHNQRHKTAFTVPEFDVWLSLGRPAGHHLSVPGDNNTIPEDTPGDKASKGQGEGQRQGQGHLNTVPTGTGGKPPLITNPDEIIFGYGLNLLISAGTLEKNARSFLGGLRKHHGDQALIDSLRECAKAKPLQPLEWLAAALPPGGAAAKPGKHAGFDKLNYREGIAADGTFN